MAEPTTALPQLLARERPVLSAAESLRQPAQTYLAHRPALVDFIDVVAEDLAFRATTVHAAVATLDRVCARRHVNVEFIWHVAAACLLLAAKFEEPPSDNLSLWPVCSCARRVAGVCLSMARLRDVEVDCFEAAGWNLHVATVPNFLCAFRGALAAACVEISDCCDNYTVLVAELSVRDGACLQHRVSVLAAASIALGRAYAGLAPLWPAAFERATGVAWGAELAAAGLALRAAFAAQCPAEAGAVGAAVFDLGKDAAAASSSAPAAKRARVAG